jgi:hypothetical protein
LEAGIPGDERNSVAFAAAFRSAGAPSERVRVFIQAFHGTYEDSHFLAEARKLGVGVDASFGEGFKALVNGVLAQPHWSRERIAGFIESGRRWGAGRADNRNTFSTST